MKRYRWEIWSQLLTEALTPTQESKLLCQANLSYDMVQEHVRALVALGFLEEKSNPHSYMFKTTWKGRVWLEQYQDLQKLLEP